VSDAISLGLCSDSKCQHRIVVSESAATTIIINIIIVIVISSFIKSCHTQQDNRAQLKK